MLGLIAVVLLIASVLGILVLAVVLMPRCPGPGETDRQAVLAVLTGVCLVVGAGSASVVIFPIDLG